MNPSANERRLGWARLWARLMARLPPRPELAALGAVGVLAGGAHLAHGQLAAHPKPIVQAAPLRLSPTAVRAFTLNLRHVAADLYYLRAVGTFGDKSQHEAHYPALAPLLQQSVALDPNFSAPYLLAGTALLLAGNDDEAGMALLRRGAAQLPQVWQLNLYRGYHAYAFRHDMEEAAQALAAAARVPEAPAFVGPLATRVAAKSSDPGAGLALLDSLLATTDDDGVRASLAARRPLLLLERRLQALQAAVAAAKVRHNRVPTQWAELAEVWPQHGAPLAQEPLAQARRDPLGGEFVLTAEGQIETRHQAERLDVHTDATPTQKTPTPPPGDAP